MKMDIKVSASILCADFKRLGDEIKKCEDAGVDMIHVDVMDGHFVPVISIGALIVEAIRPFTQLPIEAHLMVEHPGAYIDQFIEAGTDIISVHTECYGTLKPESRGFGAFPKEIEAFDVQKALGDIERIKKAGKEAFMVVNPGSQVLFDEILDILDGVLIMSVNPGFAKQRFMPEVLLKVKALREKFRGDIAIDGGVNHETAPLAVEAGVNILATASYFFGAPDHKQAVQYLKDLG